MALAGTGAALGDKIAAIITASNAPAEAKNAIKLQWEAIGEAIVNHVIEKAEVAAGIVVSIPSTSPPSSPSAGTRTGKGKLV